MYSGSNESTGKYRQTSPGKMEPLGTTNWKSIPSSLASSKLSALGCSHTFSTASVVTAKVDIFPLPNNRGDTDLPTERRQQHKPHSSNTQTLYPLEFEALLNTASDLLNTSNNAWHIQVFVCPHLPAPQQHTPYQGLNGYSGC